ncbi:LysE family translocator [Undibacterium parvum]|uniref:LysE family transporter n=2 Tax=Undibacterium TaxID=401469 RepID=A0A6M4A5W7_9BURK|nr:LysE family transporter [Undibacterium parvum]AZP10883.1 LysE family translocator [Undibacterium parvum]QJQ05459.1 LysE family transporter [Undibacterium piscinae]
MHLYLLFLAMAAATVLSPGPGVVMTITNALRFGLRGTIGGILGIAFGALFVAATSATSLGVLLATSVLAFTVLKFMGAAYLVYLGVRLWRAPEFKLTGEPAHEASFRKRFIEGLSLQLSNPKAIFFFLSVFPQFIDPERNYLTQFTTLVITYAFLVVIIHSIYATFSSRAKVWLTSDRGGRAIRRTSGVTLIIFGTILAAAKQ